MKINSEKELIDLFGSASIEQMLSEVSYHKTRCISPSEFNQLRCYELSFEPFLSIAENCHMSVIPVYQSQQTSRFYLGYLNLGSHGARGEMRPIQIKSILDVAYVEDLYKDHGMLLHAGIDLERDYEI